MNNIASVNDTIEKLEAKAREYVLKFLNGNPPTYVPPEDVQAIKFCMAEKFVTGLDFQEGGNPNTGIQLILKYASVTRKGMDFVREKNPE